MSKAAPRAGGLVGKKTIGLDLEVLFPDGRPTIDRIASVAGLQPIQVFADLLDREPNGEAMKALYEDNLKRPFPGSEEQARFELKMAGQTVSTVRVGKRIEGNSERKRRGKDKLDDSPLFTTGTPYREWFLDVSKLVKADAPGIALTESPAFLGLTEAEARRRADHVAALPPELDELKSLIGRIDADSRALDDNLASVRFHFEQDAQPVGLLTVLDVVLDLMLAHPSKDPAHDKPTDASRAAVTKLQKDLHALTAHAQRCLILQPTSLTSVNQEIEKHARELMTSLKDARVRAGIGLLLRRPEGTATLWHQTIDALRNAYVALSVTSLGTEAFEHVKEMMEVVAANAPNKHDLTTIERPAVRDVLRREPLGSPTATTPLAEFALSLAPSVIDFIGYVAGAYTPFIQQEIAKQIALYKEFPRTYRTVLGFTTSLLNPTEFKLLKDCMDKGELRRLQRLRLPQGFMGGVTIGAVSALLSTLALWSAWNAKATDTSNIRAMANLIAAIGTAASSTATVLVRLADAMELGCAKALAKGAEGFGAAVGVVVGMCATIAAAESIREASDVRDDFAVTVGYATAVSGLISIVGSLLSLAAVVTGTGVGAIPGAILAAVSAAIGIGVGVAAYVRDQNTAGSRKVFEAYILQFRKERPVGFALDHDPRKTGEDDPDGAAGAKLSEFKRALHVVMDEMRDIDFWPIDFSISKKLLEVGFGAENVVFIVDAKNETEREQIEGYAGQLQIEEARRRGERRREAAAAG